MGSVLMQFANIVIQTIINSYFLISVAQYTETKRYTKKEMAISAGIILLAITISIFLKSYSKIISSLIIIISTISILTLLLKVKPLKSIIITFISMIIFGIIEVIGVYIVMLIFNADFTIIGNSRSMLLLSIIFQSIIIFVLTKLVIDLLEKKSTIKESFKNLSSKQIGVFLISLSIYILPQLILLNMKDYSYPISFLIVNSIQFIGITLFLFIYLKRDIELEKTQNDLLTSELHNKTMVGMVDGVRTLKHDYNNIMQALNRICFYQTI